MPRTRSTVSHPSALHSTITDIKEGSIPPSIALGKRKRAKSQQRSPSPARTDSGLAEPKRKRGRPTKTEAEKRRAQRGNGDMGQFGLGADTVSSPAQHTAIALNFLTVSQLGDIARPRLHTWFEEAVEGGKLGGVEAGLEVVCAGGMHSLVIDEAGKVCSFRCPSSFVFTNFIPSRFGPGVSTMVPPWEGPPLMFRIHRIQGRISSLKSSRQSPRQLKY